MWSADTLADRVYEFIKKKILSLAFAPGEKLNVSRLAEELNVSNTPIREAINRLEKVGLVESVPYRGTFVRSLSSSEVREAYQVRAALEKLAVRLAVERITEAMLAGLDEKVQEYARALQDDDIASAVQADFGFHDLLVQASGNRVLLEVFRVLADRLHMLRYIEDPDRKRRAFLEGHVLVVQALRDRDADKAAEAIARHIRAGQQNTVRILEKRERLQSA